MSWIDSMFPPKLSSVWRKREMPENRWIKCPETGQLVFFKDLEENQSVIPGSEYHMRMPAAARLSHLFDNGAFNALPVPEVPLDPLKFKDQKRYVDRLKAAREDTGMQDAVLVGDGMLDGRRTIAAVQDFKFMGGSLGMAAGEAVVLGMLRAAEAKAPFILFAASGGARMQEGMFSLMQMPRTTVAVQRLREARVPYIVVLTHPTTGGVTASYAMLGDIHLAEPGALIGFAGPRVIEQTIREKLPEGFQRAEYLLEHGMVDQVVHRHQLRETLVKLTRVMTKAPAVLEAQRDETHHAEAPDASAALLEHDPASTTPAHGDAAAPVGTPDDVAAPAAEPATATDASAAAKTNGTQAPTKGAKSPAKASKANGAATTANGAATEAPAEVNGAGNADIDAPPARAKAKPGKKSANGANRQA